MNDVKSKRLNYELKVLDEKLINNKLSFLIGFYRENLNVVFYLDSNFGIIIVNIDFENSNYPFGPPKVYIGNDNKNNKINYIKLLNLESSRLKRFYVKDKTEINYLANILEISTNYFNKLINYTKCLCCLSILCNNMWNPCIKLDVILKEIYDNHSLVEKVRYLIFAKVIMRKFMNIIIPTIYDYI